MFLIVKLTCRCAVVCARATSTFRQSLGVFRWCYESPSIVTHFLSSTVSTRMLFVALVLSVSQLSGVVRVTSENVCVVKLYLSWHRKAKDFIDTRLFHSIHWGACLPFQLPWLLYHSLVCWYFGDVWYETPLPHSDRSWLDSSTSVVTYALQNYSDTEWQGWLSDPVPTDVLLMGDDVRPSGRRQSQSVCASFIGYHLFLWFSIC